MRGLRIGGEYNDVSEVDMQYEDLQRLSGGIMPINERDFVGFHKCEKYGAAAFNKYGKLIHRGTMFLFHMTDFRRFECGDLSDEEIEYIRFYTRKVISKNCPEGVLVLTRAYS